MTHRVHRIPITKLKIILAAILPLITTIILLLQHSSESGNPAFLGRWTYFYFIFALLPIVITLQALVLLWFGGSALSPSHRVTFRPPTWL